MSVLLDRSTRVLVQGITGKIGSFHAKDMMAYGTKSSAASPPARAASDTACRSSTP